MCVDASIGKEGFFDFPPASGVQPSIGLDSLIVVIDDDKFHYGILDPYLVDQLDQGRGNYLKANAIDSIPVGPDDTF